MAAVTVRCLRPIAFAAILTVASCTMAPAGDPRLTSAIGAYYAAHATEEQGVCRSPRIDTIQERRLLERSADGEEVMMVRYSYFDPNADMDARFDKLVSLSQPCGGIAERRFTLAPSSQGYQVTAMSGESHGEKSAP